MRNSELEEAQAGIEIAGRNINNLRYTRINPHINQQSIALSSHKAKVI